MDFLLKDRYVLAAYMLFRQHEEELDPIQCQLYSELQRSIFRGMTLEEVEKIETIYADFS
ncbi:hypothetical protein Spiaf_1498 [Spirochaeta africana DSM 8902]|uniref:Uncharacterized protein n=1 Tax=Spirochaeta africana (strain ATCC 700263 / DSM 8902 / Z-7692) TaxID=889378 RepID=H9UJ64_SPIAZ|nr:hypothetical protein Spiaf_1498 [Spirochaeta africana DSM 8902]